MGRGHVRGACLASRNPLNLSRRAGGSLGRPPGALREPLGAIAEEFSLPIIEIPHFWSSRRAGSRHEGWDLQHDAGCLGHAAMREVPRGMLTQEGDVEIHALAARGWKISKIARHTGRDRKTVRAYLEGRGGGQNPKPRASCLDPYREYRAQRFDDDPHVTAAVLFDELVEARFPASPLLIQAKRLV